MCPADGFFPSVGEGELSLSICPGGFVGYSYRQCRNGVLGDVQIDRCEYKPPSGLAYVTSSMECMIDVEVTSGVPTYTGFVTEFYMEGEASLPEGLTFNSTTGEIRGIPRATLDARAFTVCVKNPAGEACTEITISVEKRDYCEASDGFERTKVGETAVYECSMKGSYVGRQKRACVKGGEWRRVAEGDGILHVRGCDCADCGYRDHCDCGGGFRATAFGSQGEGGWWREEEA